MPQKNNFDFVRLLAASVVLLSHQYVLKGLSEPAPLPGNSWGGLAVAVFFVISGYLITESWLRDPSLWKFFIKRALRLIPGLFFVTLFGALIIGPLVSTDSPAAYFSDKNTWKYLTNIFLKIRYELPGVFIDNPYPKVVNGSIWTLPVEASWYSILAGLGLCQLATRKVAIFSILIACVCWVNQYHLPGTENKPDWFFYFGSFFLSGIYLHSIHLNAKIFLLAWIPTVCAFYFGYWFLGLIIILPISVIYFGAMSTPVICDVYKVGDISYGVYLFAFPVQQTIVHYLGASYSYTTLAGCSMIITYVLAFISWRLVEKPSLGLKKYLKN